MEGDSLCCLSGLLNFNQAEEDSAQSAAFMLVQQGTEGTHAGCVCITAPMQGLPAAGTSCCIKSFPAP